MTMDVNTICSASGVKLRAVPAGATLPESATTTSNQIATLGEMSWALATLSTFVDLSAQVRSILGQPGQPGSLNNHAWEVWGQVTKELVKETGVAAEALPIERILQKVIKSLTDEKSKKNDGDLVKLNHVLGLLNGNLLVPFQQALEKSQRPIAAGVAYAQDKSFKINIKGILERINSALPENLRGQIALSQINWDALSAANIAQAATQVNKLIHDNCASYAAAIPTAPQQQPAKPPAGPVKSPKAAQEQPSPFYLGLALLSAYGVKVKGESTAPLPFGPALRGDIALGYTVSDKTRLQLNYLPFINVSNGFNSRLSQDMGTLSLAHQLPKVTLVGQGGFFWSRNTIDGRGAFKDEYAGTAGGGIVLFNGLLYPFAGGMFGTSFGGYGGLRSSYEKNSFGISGTALFSHLRNNQLKNSQTGGSVAGTYKVSVLGTDLRIGVSAGGDYDATNKAAEVKFGLVLRLGGNNVIVPQPMTLGSGF